MTRSLAVVLSAAVVVTGCATASRDIAATYVSPMQYQPYVAPAQPAQPFPTTDKQLHVNVG